MIQDFAKNFEGPKAEIAILSTYDFDPLYFENRLLRKNTLHDARRILVFMDHHCYQQLGHNEIQARYLNQRYLLVPVNPRSGVFHPKLHLLFGNSGGRVICGSNNLTQAGSIHNLELFSLLHVDVSDGVPDSELAKEALDFFRACLPLCEGKSAKIAKLWLSDLADDYGWLKAPSMPSEPAHRVELVHTFREPPWKWLVRVAEGRRPVKFTIISPFYDKDLRLLRRIQQTWPGVPVKIFAQQRSSNMPGEVLSKLDGVELLHLEIPNSRRLHAKLIAVDFGDDFAILSGSCNFTTAAFDGGNIEVALGLRESPGFLDALFPEDVTAIPIKPDDFIPGDRGEPTTPTEGEALLRVWGATLTESGRLTFEYDVRAAGELHNLTVVLKSPGEKDPRRTDPVPKDPKSFRFIQLSDGEKAELPSSALFCRLEGRVGGQTVQSAASWVIHEHRLTHQPSSSSGTGDRERLIRDTGYGLTEYLEALAIREGYTAVIEFLQHLNIRFQDGAHARLGYHPRPPSPRDPTLHEGPPAWSAELSEEFEKSVFEFVRRHHRSVLQRHARGGNLNGLENFIDVFSACNKLLFIHCERHILKPLHVMEWFLVGLYRLAFGGKLLTLPDKIDGYMSSILRAQSGDLTRARKAMRSYAIPEQAAFALIAAQRISMVHVMGISNPANCLPSHAKYARDFFKAIRLYPDEEQYISVLQTYGIDSEEEQGRWWSYLQDSIAALH